MYAIQGRNEQVLLELSVIVRSLRISYANNTRQKWAATFGVVSCYWVIENPICKELKAEVDVRIVIVISVCAR